MKMFRKFAPMKCLGATRSRTEDRATLESDPSADPEAGMGGE